MTALAKAVSLTGAACALWIEALSGRNNGSERARVGLRNTFFNSHAKIKAIPLGAFCDRLKRYAEPSLDAVHLPLACVGNGLGTPAYYQALAATAANRNPRQVVEFGTFLGHGALVFTMNAPGCKVLTIDLPDVAGDLSNLNQADRQHVESSRTRVGQVYHGTSYESRITELKCDSRKLRLKEVVEFADLVLVDGGHDISCITADTENALAVARPGTVILWDDYFWLYPDVVQYLDRLSERLKLVRLEETGVVVHIVE